MKLFNLMETSFDTFDETVRKYLAKTFNSLGYNYTHNQIFGVLFDGIKGVMQNGMFYIEDALNEQNIYTATRRKSIYSLAKISGYEPYYGSAATGTLVGNTSVSNHLPSGSTKIYIPNYTQVMNTATGIIYTLFINSNRYVIDINNPIVSHEFKVIQGEWNNYQYSCTGEPLEKISVDASGLFDAQYIEVYINGEKWTPVSSLYDMSHDSKEYIITIGYENTFDILFGNGVYGKVPASGDTVVINYLSHSGSNGNIKSFDNPIFKFNTPGYDSTSESVDLNNYIKLTMKNIISGGTDADSIDFVRNMVGYNSRSNVLASEENFKLFFKRFSFIGHVNCWSSENSMTIYVTCISNIIDNVKTIDEYYKLTSKFLNPKEDGILLTKEQEKMIIETLKNSNKSFAGLSIKFQDPIIRRFAIFCYVKTDNNYSKDDIKESIYDVMGRYFLSLDEDCSFIPKSDLIQLGANCHEDIKSFDIDIVSELTETTYKDGYYIKMVQEYNNGDYNFVSKKVMYESDVYPGLDEYGNISLETKLEVPVLGSFRYYPNKENNDKSSINLDYPIQIIWI